MAVLEPLDFEDHVLDMKDVELKDQRGTGPGGQHRNTTNSCIVATHLLTKISVRIDERSQYQSKRIALAILAQKIADIQKETKTIARDKTRKLQVGSGMRSDKIRTYRTQDDRVTDHRTGQTWNLRKWMKGEW